VFDDGGNDATNVTRRVLFEIISCSAGQVIMVVVVIGGV